MRTSWSYSRLRDYEACPHRRALWLAGAKEQGNEYAKRGQEYHALCEQTLRQSVEAPIPPPLSPWEAQIRTLRAKPIEVEQLWGFDEDFAPCSTSLAWCRMKCDVVARDANRAVVVDWKTGKKKHIDHAQQGLLYLIGLQARMPDVAAYRYEFYYLEDKPLISQWMTASQVKRAVPGFMRRVKRMLNDKELKPKPSKYNCLYCGFRHACQYAIDESK